MKNKIKHFYLLLLFIAVSGISVNGQSTFWSFDFETEGGYTTSTPEFTDDLNDYFIRTDGTNISSGIELTNVQGNYYFAAQDIDADGGSTPQTLTFENIDIANYENIAFNILLAEDDDGTNQDWDEDDFVHIDYKLSSEGTYTPLLWIENDGSEYNSAPLIDTDFDGTGDGSEITSAFTSFPAIISKTGNAIDIKITISLDSGDEDIALDQLQLLGTYVSPANDATSVANSTGVTQPDAANISSLNDESTEALKVFSFNIDDLGTADGLPTIVESLTIKAGTNNTADWTKDIDGGFLMKGTTPLSIPDDKDPIVLADQVTFFIDDGELEINDGGNQVIDLYVWLNDTTTDNAVIQCMIDADNHGFIADNQNGSAFADDFGTDVVGNDFTVDVIATQMAFVTQPSNVFSGETISPAPKVALTDENMNVDVDYSETEISLSLVGDGNLSGTTTLTTTAATATFSDLSIDKSQTNAAINADCADFNSITSNTFNVSYNILSEDFETTSGDGSTLIQTDLNNWTNIEETGSEAWVSNEYSSNKYAEISSYQSGEANKAWLITPPIDLDETDDEVFTFDVKVNFWTHPGLEVFVSNDFDGTNIGDATWTDITADFTIPTEPTSGFGSFINAGSATLDAYSGTNYIAFKYTGDDNASETTTYQLDNIEITGIKLPDTKAPIATFTPENGATDVPVGSNITLEMNEAVYKANGSAFGDDEDVSSLVSIFESVSENPIDASITISGQTITIDPVSNLANNVSYTVTLSANALEDAAGNENTEQSAIWVTIGGNPPEMTTITNAPVDPSYQEAVTIQADVTDNTAVSMVMGYWGTTDSDVSNALTMENTSGDTYASTTQIPAQSIGSTIFYKISATDEDDNTSTSEILSYTVSNEVTIAEIQDEATSFTGKEVVTGGVVTGLFPNEDPDLNFMTIQDGTGAWNGIWVNIEGASGIESTSLGDNITITGTVKETYGNTELHDINFTTVRTGDPLPTPVMLTTNEVADEQYEGVLVKISRATWNGNASFGEHEMNDGSGMCLVHDLGYDFTISEEVEYDVSGPVYYAYSKYKIEPRFAADIVESPDITAPEFESAFVEDNAPADVVVTFSEAVTLSDATGFSVEVDGSPVTIESVAGSGTATVTFTLASAVAYEQTVTINYDGSGDVADMADTPNALLAFDTEQSVTNNVLETRVLSLNNMDINLYPNPVQNILTITNVTTVKNIQIMNVTGQAVKAVTPVTDKAEINVSDLQSGIYFVKFVDENGNSITTKIIKN